MTIATLDAADQTLHDSARGSSFHMAMLLLPKDKRKALLTLYAVCRKLDDAVDDATDSAQAQATLDAWERNLDRIFTGGTPDLPLAQELQSLQHRYGLRQKDLRALFAALRMDAGGRMLCPDGAELETYCHGVASAVGLMAMRIFGCEGDHARRFAISLGHALQLTNILRDVHTDAAIGRIYLPREWMAAPITPGEVATSPEIRPACIHLARKAESYFMRADNHAQHLPPRAIAPALAMRDVYATYWRKLKAADWHAPVDGRIRLSPTEKAGLTRRASGYMLGKFRPVEL